MSSRGGFHMPKLSPNSKSRNQLTPPRTPPRAPSSPGQSIESSSPPPAADTADWRNELTIQSQFERIQHLEQQLASERQTRLVLESQVQDQMNIENLRREITRARKETEAVRREVQSARNEANDAKRQASVAESKLQTSEMDRLKLEFLLDRERIKLRDLQKKSQSQSPEVATLESAVLARHFNQWDLFGRIRAAQTVEGGGVAEREVFRFEDVPWPVFALPESPEGITKVEVRRFVVASAAPGQERSLKRQVKDWLLIWHPDKFQGLWLRYIVASDKEIVRRATSVLTQVLNDILAEAGSSRQARH
ncbi:hypothetical protein BDV93DRAFT_553272 [Ceratobasidium sp. AG-I]|nr:hypothetical protein BDV93DRAFT_553272 [Ceratobasidium sp. AG-I]